MTDNLVDRARQLVDRPSESLAVELKRWIDPDQPEHIAKIVRAALALRNHNGGFLVIGFDNETSQPDTAHAPKDAKAAFHIDKIQGYVAKFASEPFEIAIEFPVRDEQAYPVIAIPAGVRTPVATKGELKGLNGPLISTGDVYIRSLRANNTASTTKARWNDWPQIVEICFENREADIGRFLRRHLGGANPSEFLSALQTAGQPVATPHDELRGILREGSERFAEVVAERKAQLPKHGSWEVAMLIVGAVPPHGANTPFLNLLDSSNPDYTGWPIWLDSRGFSDQTSRPYVVEGVWEAFMSSLKSSWGNDHLDFMRLDPRGRFYLRRALQDDMVRSERSIPPLTQLDFALAILRTAEAIAVGIAFARAMGCDPEKTFLAYVFRWTGLRGRTLTSWANPERHLSSAGQAYDDVVESVVDVPLDTPLSALDDYVGRVIARLFEVFDGFAISKSVIEDLTRRVIERRL
jgi:hypothetical protein